MSATAYPLPRETRESTVLAGNGTAGPYGPSLYKIFDTVDVKVFSKLLGATIYTDVTAHCTIAKVNPANAYDYFTVTFDANVLASTSWYHQARRTAERSIAVIKGGALDSNELEKELSKQASVQSELRRDINRAVKSAFGTENLELPIADNGKFIGWNSDGRLVNKTVVDLGNIEVLDEDNMASNSPTAVPSQQSVKAYVDAGDAATRALIAAGDVATRTALKAVDTTVYKKVFLSEAGREGTFIWLAGNYSTHIATDTLEGIYIKANAVASTAGAWVRLAGFLMTGADPHWFGAVGDGTTQDHAAINAAGALLSTIFGGGEVRLRPLTYAIGDSGAGTGVGLTAGIDMKSRVTLSGAGYTSRLKAVVANIIVLSFYIKNRANARNLCVDGNSLVLTTSESSAIEIDGNSGTDNVENTLDTVWIENAGGYGIGCQWGNHKGLFLRNIVITGSGRDGIDIKAQSGGPFEGYAMVLENIFVRNFGRFASDGNDQAGVDIRGRVLATNINVREFGAQASTGIRVHGGYPATNHIGGHKSKLVNCHVERISGGIASTLGFRLGGDQAVMTNCHAEGCTTNFIAFETGTSGTLKDARLIGCTSKDATSNGFAFDGGSSGCSFIGCADQNSPIGFYVAGNDNALINPTCGGNAQGIVVAAGALRAQVNSPIYRACTVKIVNNEPTAFIWPANVIETRSLADFVGADVATAQPVFTAAQDALTVAADTTYDVDAFIFMTKSAGVVNHSIAFLLGGTATFDSMMLALEVTDATSNILTAIQRIFTIAATATTFTAGSTNAARRVLVRIKGTIRTNAGGTIIPQIQNSAAAGGALTFNANNYFRLTEIGTDQMTIRGAVA